MVAERELIPNSALRKLLRAMAAAGAPADPELLIEVQELRTMIQGLDTTVTNIGLSVQQLTQDMSDLHVRHDGGIYGETYATDAGPAIRAKFFESFLTETRSTISRLNMSVDEQALRLIEVHDNTRTHEVQQTSLSTTMSEQTAEVNATIERLDGELQALRTEGPAARTPAAARIPKNITGTKGFEKLKAYSGDAAQWPEWRFRVTTWLVQENSAFESLIGKLDKCEAEPTEPEVGSAMTAGSTELTLDEEWCSEQLYQLMVQKFDGSALAIVRNQNTRGKVRGLVAWYRTLREAEGQMETKKQEITERVFYSGRKAVAAKDVAATIEVWERELREYKDLTGNSVDNTLKVLNLKRILPEAIRKMLQTMEITDYSDAKEYVLKQARAMQKEKEPHHGSLDLAEDEKEKEQRSERKVKFEEEPNDGETYTHDELLAWIGKGPGKGGKGGGKKGSKGKFEGNCHYCGTYGHRISECRKKDSEIKGKGQRI